MSQQETVAFENTSVNSEPPIYTRSDLKKPQGHGICMTKKAILGVYIVLPVHGENGSALM